MANPLVNFMDFPAAFGGAIKVAAIVLLIAIIFGAGSCVMQAFNGH